MHVSYNGVVLELLTIDRAERRSILTPDQTQVLYTEWALSLSCVYAPSQVAYNGADLGGTSIEYGSPGDATRDESAVITPIGVDPSVVNFTMPGSVGPIYSDKELHLRLSVPRQPLIIWGYGTDGRTQVWLASPRPVGGGLFLPRDAFNGPIVQANVVTANLGGGNVFGVQLEVKTWVPPCPAGSDRAVLAHRWQMAHHRDENNYLTRTTTGELYFHGGLADAYSFNRGLIARQFFHPIPLGFRRYMGPVTLSPDGLVVRYGFSDVDQTIVFDAGGTGATTIAISENVQYTAPFQVDREGLQKALKDFGPLLFGGIPPGAITGSLGSLLGGGQ
jgi:hypothetical protein